MTRGSSRGVRALVALLVALGGCAQTLRPPQRVARGELTVAMEPAMTLRAGGMLVAVAPTFEGLPAYVACVPAARVHAERARSSGRRARAFAVLGSTLGFGALVGFGALADRDHAFAYLGAALGSGLSGTVFAARARLHRRGALGHAVDATNEYDDAVGSLGGTCADLRFAAPAGPPPPIPYPRELLPPPAR